MSKEELIAGILSYENKIGMWSITLNYITEADFVMGYGFDKATQLWKVYKNYERGMQAKCTFDTEEEALEELYGDVKFQYKMLN